MCGRAAQTQGAVRAAAEDFMLGEERGALGRGDHRSGTSIAASPETTNNDHSSTTRSRTRPMVENNPPVVAESSSTSTTLDEQERNNYNLSPGMDAWVFFKDERDQEIRMERKTWGLVTKGGTANSPLPENDMGLHFKNLVFNARSDTLFEKPTFSRLANARRSCLIAVDGFFEWKTELGKKQPYFVYRRKQSEHRPYLLFAGLWTNVSTGRSDSPMLETFTILTTEACAAIQWLHTRMPVVVWDPELAQKWLDSPSVTTLTQLDEAARRTDESLLQWHAVSPQMSSMKFRTADAIKPIPQTKSVKSFFSAAAAEKTTTSTSRTGTKFMSGGKRPAGNSPSSTLTKSTGLSSSKQRKIAASSTPQKRGPMDAFFKRKST